MSAMLLALGSAAIIAFAAFAFVACMLAAPVSRRMLGLPLALGGVVLVTSSIEILRLAACSGAGFITTGIEGFRLK